MFRFAQHDKIDIICLRGDNQHHAKNQKLGNLSHLFTIWSRRVRKYILSSWVFYLLIGTQSGPFARGEITLSGETSEPMHSAFVAGKPVELSFTVSGLSVKDTSLKLHLKIVNELEKVIEEKDLAVQADDKGQWTGRVAGPNGKLGFYRVYAALSNGVTIPRRVSRPAGYITYCVAADPSKRKMYPAEEMFFGMYGGLGGAGMHAALDPYLGVYWDIGIWTWGWGNIEADFPGQCVQKFKAAKEAREKSKADSAGNSKKPSWMRGSVPALYIIPTRWKVPPVVGIPRFYTAPLTPEGEKYWAEYCRNAVKAYAEENPERTERFYQITWEPIVPWGFSGTDEELIRIYQVAYPAIHQADPKAVVVGPTTSNIERDTDLLRRLFAKGLGKYLDGFCTHPYTSMPPEYNRFRENILTIKEIIRQYVGRDLPMFATELGYATGEQKENELLQAQGLVRSNLILLGEGYRLSIAFYYHDYLCEAGYGFFYNLNPQINYGTDKIAPKPIVPAYAAMSRLLEGHHSAGVIDWLGQTALGYAYERGNEIILALWDYGDSPRTVTLPVGVPQVTVYDWMGNSRQAKTEKGVLRIELKPEPVYIAGVAPGLWSSKAVKQITINESRIKTFPGCSVVIRGSVTSATGKAFDGHLILECDKKLNVEGRTKKEIHVKPQAKEPFEYPFAIPADMIPESYPVSLILTEGNTPVAAGGCVVKVVSPVTLAGVEPFFTAGGNPGLRIKAVEIQGRDLAGTFDVRVEGVPESKKKQAFQLGARQERSFELVYGDLAVQPFQTYPARVTMTTQAGYTVTTRAPVNFMAAGKLSNAIKMDGDLTEWGKILPIPLEGLPMVNRNPEQYQGNDDLRAEVRFAWDDQALYLAAEVTDDVYFQDQTGFLTWMGDCIQMDIDLDPRKDDRRTGNDLADKGNRHRFSEINLALTSKGPEAYRTVTFDEQKFPLTLLTAKDLPLVVRHNGNRLIYEAAIPWKTLGGDGPPKDGLLGFAMSVNDRDNVKQVDPTALSAFQLKDTRKFGLMILGETKK
jgi:hypothetical protein